LSEAASKKRKERKLLEQWGGSRPASQSLQSGRHYCLIKSSGLSKKTKKKALVMGQRQKKSREGQHHKSNTEKTYTNQGEKRLKILKKSLTVHQQLEDEWIKSTPNMVRKRG